MEKFKNPQKWFRVYFSRSIPFCVGTKGFRFLGITFMWGEGNFGRKMPYFMIVWNNH